MTTLTELAQEILKAENERQSYSNTLIEIRQMLGIEDNEVWTQDVLREKLARLAELEGNSPELSVVED